MNLEEQLGQQVFKNPSCTLFLNSSILSIFASPIILAVLYKFSFEVVSSYFYISLNFVAIFG